MRRIGEKIVRKSEEELKGRCQLKDLGVVWKVILNVKVKAVTFLPLITLQPIKLVRRSGHGCMTPVVSRTNMAV
jgi:hypothetical protein